MAAVGAINQKQKVCRCQGYWIVTSNVPVNALDLTHCRAQGSADESNAGLGHGPFDWPSSVKALSKIVSVPPTRVRLMPPFGI
jgi:hypothetical protein